MTLGGKTRDALNAVPRFAGGNHPLRVSHEGLTVACDLSALDTLGCEFTRFAVHSDKLVGAAMDELKHISETLAARLTYLLEPIRPIETDPEGCVIQMRSHPPRRDEKRTTYYEILVRRVGELSLCRWEQHPGSPRQPLAAQVTREVLLRLVEDFAAVAK